MADAAPSSYDGFLSYSHAADDLLAPRLQAGLQRFAKPWWKRRALRVFRDEASLSANPHLWSSITEALDDSDWFVLLLSPEAAGSEWVNREIDYWKEHKDPARILPVVTDGAFAWEHDDVTGDAVPPSLRGVFEDEPRWVDLRFARTEAQLNLRHTRFRDAVADIAAAVRGVAKDELESEEIRQHRRTVRTAWTGGIAILALGIAATVGAVVAFNAQQDAEDSAALAQEERDRAVAAEQAATEERDRANLLAEQEAAARAEAEQQRTLAEQESDRAEENATEAVRAAQEARARELAAAALLNLDDDPERSILLAIEAVNSTGDKGGPVLHEPIMALRQAVAASRVVSRFEGGWFVDYNPDGSLIATGLWSGPGSAIETAIWDADTGEQIHVLSTPERRESPIETSPWLMDIPSFSPDGRHLAVAYTKFDQPGPLAMVWDVATGERVAAFGEPEIAANATWVGFHPDGAVLAVDTPDMLVAWDIASGSERYRIDHSDLGAWSHSFSADGTLLAIAEQGEDTSSPSRVALFDAHTGVPVESLPVGNLDPIATAFDPTGRRLAALSQWPPGLMLWDVESWEMVLSLELSGNQTALEWSPDGETIAVAGNEGVPRLLDATTGEEVLALLGHDALISGLAFSPDGGRIAGTGPASDTVVWDVTKTGSREVATLKTPYSVVGQVKFDADGTGLLIDTTEPFGELARLDATTGQIIAEIPDQIIDWPVLARPLPEAGLVASLNVDGIAALHDAQTFEPIATLPEGFFVLAVSQDRTRVVMRSLDLEPEAVVAEIGSWEVLTTIPGNFNSALISPDGSLMSGYAGIGIFDLEQDAWVFTSAEVWSGEWIPVSWSPDGSLLAIRTLEGRLGLVDVAALREGTPLLEALVVNIDAHKGMVRDPVPFSRDGSLMASWGQIDHHLKVWDTGTGQLVADLGEKDYWSGIDFHPNGRHLVTGGPDGTIRILTLDTNELLDIARSRVTRGFTAGECATYHIDPCPNLETIRGGD